MSYRKGLENHAYYGEDIKYIEHEAVIDILDEIENKVNNIVDILESIQGLNEIDNAKESLNKLSKDLY